MKAQQNPRRFNSFLEAFENKQWQKLLFDFSPTICENYLFEFKGFL